MTRYYTDLVDYSISLDISPKEFNEMKQEAAAIIAEKNGSCCELVDAYVKESQYLQNIKMNRRDLRTWVHYISDYVSHKIEYDEIKAIIDSLFGGFSTFKTLKDFEDFLLKRKFEPEKPYGIFEKDISVCRFFESKNNENILADIERKNKEQNMGNITIPNTGITLINYSICPQCETVFSFKDLMDYYSNPKPDPAFVSRGRQKMEDTRVCCPHCVSYFLPALVISGGGTPKNEVQFLCRSQTVHSVEEFFMGKKRLVLSRKRENVTITNGIITIKNDIPLQEMATKPALISNMLQYTPVPLLPNLIDGTNVSKGDILFGKWKQFY